MKQIIVALTLVLSIALGITLAHAGGKGGGLGLGAGSGPPSGLPPTNHATSLDLSDPPGLANAGGLTNGQPPGWGKASSTPSPAWSGSLAPPPFRKPN
jgi:hypothetical protein